MSNTEPEPVPFPCQGCQEDIEIPCEEGEIAQCVICGTYNILVDKGEEYGLNVEFHACYHGRNDDCPLCW